MINILLFLFFIGCSSLAAAMLVDNPGNVTMIWMNYQLETSVSFIIFAVILLLLTTILLTLLIRKIITAPSEIWRKRNVNQLKSGLSELTYSIAELASSNINAAEKHLHKVEKLIGHSPLTLLLSAQIAKSRGDEIKTQNLLERLLTHKETEYLAARSLSDNASKQQNLPKALLMARKANGLNPKDEGSSLAVISLLVRMGSWNEALAACDNSKLPRNERINTKALIQLTYGEHLLAEERNEESLRIANIIISKLSDFPPAVAFVARAYSKNNFSNKAIKLLVKSWKKNQSPLYPIVLSEIITAEPIAKKEKLKAKLSGKANDGIWQCSKCEHSQVTWGAHCDSCNSFNSFEWKHTHL